MRVILALVACLLCWPTADAAAQRKPCPRPVVAESWYATLAWKDAARNPDRHVLEACVKAGRRRVTVGAWVSSGSSFDGPEPHFALTERHAAFHRQTCSDPTDAATCTSVLRLTNLRTGAARTVRLDAPASDVLVLSARGSAALSFHDGRLLTVGAAVETLDTAVDQGSLAYAPIPSRLYWTALGEVRTALLR